MRIYHRSNISIYIYIYIYTHTYWFLCVYLVGFLCCAQIIIMWPRVYFTFYRALYVICSTSPCVHICMIYTCFCTYELSSDMCIFCAHNIYILYRGFLWNIYMMVHLCRFHSLFPHYLLICVYPYIEVYICHILSHSLSKYLYLSIRDTYIGIYRDSEWENLSLYMRLI